MGRSSKDPASPSREVGLRVRDYAILDQQGGRMEKRLPISIIVNLTMVQNQSPNGTELTYTDNISAHGACVVSSHAWQLGEVAEVTSLVDQITLRGNVVHNHKRGDGRYAVGLKFHNGGVAWSTYRRYAVSPGKQ